MPRYIALGDSYTIGEGVEAPDRWPVQLARALRDAGTPLDDPELVAQTGWTTDELEGALDRLGVRGPAGLVTLQIGVNDQYRGRPVASYHAGMRALLGRAITLADGDPARVLTLSIPDWGVTPFNTTREAATVAREVDAFNAVARAACAEALVPFLDITDLTRASPRDVVADGLHPTGAMYAQWVARALPQARGALAAGSAAP